MASCAADGIRDALTCLTDYTPELAKAHGAQLNGAFTYDTLKRYVTDTIPAEFLP